MEIEHSGKTEGREEESNRDSENMERDERRRKKEDGERQRRERH